MFMFINGQKINLLKDFSWISLQMAQQQATMLWNVPNADTLHHTCGTPLYNSRLFALFLLNSLMPDFAALLHSCSDNGHTMDGPLLFLTICNHVHCNHLAFIESIKHKIRLSTLNEHKNDVPAYLRFLQDNLCIISSTGGANMVHSDLIPHIFMQLRNTTIPLFQQKILMWQQNYMESSLKVSPMKLVSLANEECQILKHSNQWVETIDPKIVVMKGLVQENVQAATAFLEQLSAHLTRN
jgi:hypothetical protein